VSNISGVYWRYNGNYDNGDKVVICGKLTFYTKNGTYQISASNIIKSGIGDISVKYQKMKDDFDKKGYFLKKRVFPQKINNVAIITSLEGAALQDILYVLNHNKFCGNVYIKNCLAQGQGCPKSVKEGIEYFNEYNKNVNLDVLIIARGGGSIEDLIGYSSEEVVKAIYQSDIFTISAIGHEIDNMLSDFAADCRAPTPSISAELLIKNKKEEFDNILKKEEKLKELKYNILSKIQNHFSQLEKMQNVCNLKNPINIIDGEIDKFDTIKKKLRDKISFNLRDDLYEIEKYKMKNNNYNIKKNMKNGYVVIVDENDNLINTKIEFENKKQEGKMKIVFKDGDVFL
jgi:exodeoxyribonuclease VII large subunit